MKEKLQEYALIAEVIGALAVVVSLVFVGLQVRQSSDQVQLNTRAIQTSAYQDLNTQILSITESMYANPELAEMIMKDTCGISELTPLETQRMAALGIHAIRHGDMAFYMYQQGLVDEERLDSAMMIVGGLIGSSKVVNDIWSLAQNGFDPEFVAYLRDYAETRSGRLCWTDMQSASN